MINLHITNIMEHPLLCWKKKYGIDTSDELLEFFISSHKKGYFSASLAYCELNKFRMNNYEKPAYTFKFEYFVGISEDIVYEQCKKWIEDKFQLKYKIIQK